MTRIDDATCLGCACLCDDIGISVEMGRIVDADRACAKGLAWYQEEAHRRDQSAVPLVEGRPVEFDQAIDRAIAILGDARSPLVWGLDGSSIEAQRIALAIADQIGAIIATPGDHARSTRRGFVRVGEVGATLGEVKARADLIVYLGGEVSGRWPRFRERYAEEAVGALVRRERTALQIEWPDSDDRWAALFATLRAVVNGLDLVADRVERATGLGLADLTRLADQFKAAAYGAFVVSGTLGGIASEAFLTLVRDLNAFTRFVAVMPPDGDGPDLSPGAEAVMTWGAGYPDDVDFSQGYPRSLPGDGARDRLRRGEIDAALVVGDPREITGIPLVVVGGPPVTADVWFPSASAGIDEGGSVLRFDGVMLPLRPPLPDRRIGQVEILRAIETGLRWKDWEG